MKKGSWKSLALPVSYTTWSFLCHQGNRITCDNDNTSQNIHGKSSSLLKCRDYNSLLHRFIRFCNLNFPFMFWNSCGYFERCLIYSYWYYLALICLCDCPIISTFKLHSSDSLNPLFHPLPWHLRLYRQQVLLESCSFIRWEGVEVFLRDAFFLCLQWVPSSLSSLKAEKNQTYHKTIQKLVGRLGETGVFKNKGLRFNSYLELLFEGNKLGQWIMVNNNDPM